MSITVYAVDAQNCLVHASQSSSKGYRDVVVAPTLTAPAGEVLQWVTTLDPSKDNPIFGTEGTGNWTATPDFRKTPLYLTADGTPYTVGSTVNSQTYDGLGALPAWLTDTARPGVNYTWESGAWTLDVAAQLAADQASQIAVMEQAYVVASTANVGFTSGGGVEQTYQADGGENSSQSKLLQAFTWYEKQGAVPAGFYWMAADNTRVPFTVADLSGLYGVMLAQGLTAFQRLQDRKVSIRAATTSAEALAVTW